MLEIFCNVCKHLNMFKLSNPSLANPKCEKCGDILLEQNDEVKSTTQEYVRECPHCALENDLFIHYPDICGGDMEIECTHCNKAMYVTADVRYSFTVNKI